MMLSEMQMGRRVYQTPAPGNLFCGEIAMAVLTQTLKIRKPRAKPERTMRIGKLINGVLSLAIADGRGEHDAYLIRQIPTDWGRGFEITNVAPKPGDEAVYHLHIDESLGDSCTCPGHTYKGKCKHLDAVKT